MLLAAAGVLAFVTAPDAAEELDGPAGAAG
jgi:hypothetical protein